MASVSLEIVIILVLLVLNGVFAMSELATMSARKARLQQRADEGDHGAQVALDLIESPNRFLSTVQIGITLIGILAGAFGGATIANSFAAALATIPALAPSSQPLAVGLVVLVITYLSLVIGELVPKRLALQNPEGIASRVAPPMQLLSRRAAPAVALLSWSTDMVLRLLRVRPSDEAPVTDEEIKLLFEQGTQAGVFGETEQDLIEGVLRAGDLHVNDLMTPRPRIVWLDIDDPTERHWQTLADTDFTYYPVYETTPDNVLGLVSVKDLWTQLLHRQMLDLRAALREPLYVPETMLVLKLVETFKQHDNHFALVIDEYGGIQGLISETDILDALARDIPAENGEEARIVQRDDGSWLVDGLVPVDEFIENIPVGELPGAAQGDFQTLGGFVLAQLGRIPHSGEHFNWDGWRFEVVDMDGNRVDKVLVSSHTNEVK